MWRFGEAGLAGFEVLADRRYAWAGLLSLHLRGGTRLDEIIGKYGGRDMAPTPDELDGGTVVWSTGVGDAIAQVLRQYSEENSDHA